LNTLPPSFSFISLTIFEIVLTGLTFPFTYMYTQYLYHIYPPTSLPYILPLPTGNNFPDRTCCSPCIPATKFFYFSNMNNPFKIFKDPPEASFYFGIIFVLEFCNLIIISER
jgi:hypothetical protein